MAEVTATERVLYKGATLPSMTWTILDSTGAARSLAGHTFRMNGWKPDKTTAAWTLTPTVGGAGNNVITATYSKTTATASAEVYQFAVWDLTLTEVIAVGAVEVDNAVFDRSNESIPVGPATYMGATTILGVSVGVMGW